MTALQNALASSNGHHYNAQLPDVIGHITVDEAALLVSLSDGVELSLTDNEEDYGVDGIRDFLPKNKQNELHGVQIARYLLPNLMTQIERDIALILGGQGALRFVELEKGITKAGEVAKGTGNLHVDTMVNNERDLHSMHYLAAVNNSTLFYRGAAKLFALNNGQLRLDTESLDTSRDGAIMQAPSLAIVRANGATVHGSPRFTEEASRPWLRISAGLMV